MKVLIVGGGSEPSQKLLEKYAKSVDKIIGVDRGCSYLLKNNIYPNYIVGDFDSINEEDIKKLEVDSIKKFKYNCEKDSTDSDIAVEIALNMKFTEIYMISMTGSRLDHTFANLGLLCKANNAGVKAYIINETNKIYLLEESSIIKKDITYKYISFLAYSNKVENLSIKNAKYDLENYTLYLGDNRTVSNEFLEKDIKVEFTKGRILVIFSKD
ncbi:MAG: thiamine diphosphokinase [Clostridium sp.]|nr:thiamine diphosphokinase [Clostridium sp.]